MNKITYFHLYLFGWVLYTIKFLFPYGESLGPVIMAPLLLFSFYIIIKVNLKFKVPSFMKVLNILLFVSIIYGIGPIIRGDIVYSGKMMSRVASYNYLLTMCMSLCPIYVFYYYSKLYSLKDRIGRYFFVFFFCSIFVFINTYYEMIMYVEADEVTNNAGYYFLPLIPVLLLTHLSTRTKAIWMVLILFFILFSMKRGVIAIGGVLFVLYLFRLLRNAEKKNKIRIVFLVIGVSIITSVIVAKFYDSNDYFQYRVEETLNGNTSGRDEMYEKYFEYFAKDASVKEHLFGVGINSTLKVFGKYAHNDWIETAFNQGLMGVVLLALYWLSFVQIRNKSTNSSIKFILGLLFIIYFISSFISMSIMDMPFYATFCIGYCVANYKNNNLPNTI